MPRISVDRTGCSRLNDLPGVHHSNSVGISCDDPKVVGDIQSVVKNASLIELELMLEAVKILVSYQDPASTDSLIAALKSTERKSMEIREAIVEAIGKNGSKDEVYTLIELYQISKTNNARMNKLLATTLGEIGDEKVIPILMEIAKNKNLHVSIRNQAVEVLAKKQAPELVDFFAEMIGDPATRDKVNEYALTVMGELGEERMILALLEAYQVGKHEYYSLMNTILTGLDNYDNPGMKPIYLEIAKTVEYPSNIRLKALRELTRYSDPEVISAIVEMLNHPGNYLYYNEIIAMLRNYELYEDYKPKLRMGAYNAMMEDLGKDTPIGVYHD